MRERMARLAPWATKAAPQRAVARVYTVGSSTFTAPYSDFYTFVCWGSGSAGDTSATGGASGALTVTTRFLKKGRTVAVVVGAAADSTVTFPDGTVATAGYSTSYTTAGSASGGDVNTNGNLPAGGAGVGATAPSYGVYAGGAGSSTRPGHGAGGNTTGNGAVGLCIAHAGKVAV